MNGHRALAISRRQAYVLVRAPQRWFDVVVWPVVDALLFGAIGVYFARQSGAGAKGAGFLLAGILLFHVVFQAEISLATGFMEETWSRNLLNLLVTPLREGEYATGVVLFGLAKLAIGVTVVGLVALGLFAFNITDVGLALVPIVVPWTSVSISPGAASSADSPAMKPSAWFSGVLGTLATRNRRVAASTSSRSVKVPPTSTPTIYRLTPPLQASRGDPAIDSIGPTGRAAV